MADLTTYAGRAKRRPPGASDFTQRLYRLLYEHPEGMTRDEIHEVLHEGWMETDAYRAYLRKLEYGRNGHLLEKTPTPPEDDYRRLRYATSQFKAAAQRAWISAKLADMRKSGTARQQDARWFVGRRVPKIQGQRRTLVDFDPVESRAVLTSTTAEHVQREKAKETALMMLNDKRFKGPRRDQVQLIYDQLCGRA